MMREGGICGVLKRAAYIVVFPGRDSHFLLVLAALLYNFMDCETNPLCRRGYLTQRDG